MRETPVRLPITHSGLPVATPMEGTVQAGENEMILTTNRARKLGALGLATGLLLGACSSGGSDSGAKTTSETKATATTTADASAATARASGLLQDGLDAVVAGDTPLATRKFRAVIVIAPRSKLAHYNLGLIYQRQGDLAKAETSYRRAIAIDPTFAPALYNLGILRTNAGATAEAIALYRRATRANPKLAVAFLNLGLALNATGKTEAANAALSRALQLDPSLNGRIPAAAEPTVAPAAQAGAGTKCGPRSTASRRRRGKGGPFGPPVPSPWPC